MVKSDFKVLSGRSQLLEKPQMWIGSMDKIVQSIFVVENNSIEQKEITFIPALRKIIDEILDNSLDALIKYSKSSGIIKVKIERDSVYIEDNGCGIPVRKQTIDEITDTTLSKEEVDRILNTYIAENAWCRLFSGSNFTHSDDKTTIGSHGVGSTATNVFSIKFIGHTDDGINACTVTSLNNMEKTETVLEKTSKKTGTWVHFWPDLKRFGLEEIEQVYSDLMYQRLLCLSITFPKIKFYFNGSKINVDDKNFLSMFSKNIETNTFDNGFIGIASNNQDEFNFFTYVNGLSLIRGGTHVDYVVNNIVNIIRDKLVKKYKTIKPADIKNKMTAVIFFRDFPNLKFDSQTKETLTNSNTEISKFISDKVDFEDLAKKILKNAAIIDPIVEMFKLKEELKSRQELKKSKKIRIKTDKYMAPIGDKKYFLICEGLSARGGLSSALGRNGFAYYAARGVPLNAYDAKIQAISSNQELKDISNILELDLFGKEETKSISFKKIVFANDADTDGIFIASQYIGWFTRFAPNLFKDHKIARLITPLAVIKDKREKPLKYFYSLKDFKEYESNNDLSKVIVEYYKGLGSWDKDSFIELFDKNGFEYFLQDLNLDDEGKVYVNDWLSGAEVEKRKQYLRDYTLDIETM